MIEEETLDLDEELVEAIRLSLVEDFLVAEGSESSGNRRGRGTGSMTDQPTSSTGSVPHFTESEDPKSYVSRPKQF